MSLTRPIGLGMTVYFKSKVYRAPFAPYYDAYKGHKFQVVAIHDGYHIELKCLTGDVKVAGHVHGDELKRA